METGIKRELFRKRKQSSLKRGNSENTNGVGVRQSHLVFTEKNSASRGLLPTF